MHLTRSFAACLLVTVGSAGCGRSPGAGAGMLERMAKTAPKTEDWRGDMIARIRKLIEEADPDMVEEQKWKKPSNSMAGVPAWSHDGLVCTGETYKNYVKITFAHGAELRDPAKLFNASLEGNARRAIDLREGDTLNAAAFKALIKAAVARNKKK